MSMSSLKTIKILNLKNSLFFRYPNFYLGEAVFDKNNDKEKKKSRNFLSLHEHGFLNYLLVNVSR